MTKRTDWVCDGPECKSVTTDLDGDHWMMVRRTGELFGTPGTTLVVELHFCSHECLHGYVQGTRYAA